jgi:putative transferase (TIGR04331 family)
MSVSKILILGQIPANYNPDIHIPIGPFCFASKENIYEGWMELNIAKDPFETLDEFKKAETICNDYAYSLLTEKTHYFNKQLNLNYSEKFWKVLLFPWLIYVIQSTYERQVRVKNSIELYKNDPIHVELVKDNIEWKFKNCLDYVDNGIQGIIYNEWLFSRIIEHNMPDNWTYKYIDRSIAYSKIHVTKKNKSFLSRLRNNRIIKLRKGFLRVYEVYGFKFFDFTIFNILLGYLYFKGKILKTNLNERPYSLKSPTHTIKWDFDFEALLDRVITRYIINLPERLLRVSQNRYSHNKINLISAAQITNTDNDLKVKYALRYEHGEKIISVQHGGHNYGTSLLNSIPSMVEYNHHRFITWGWNAQESYKGVFVPLPNPFLSNYANKHKPRTSKIILVGNYMNYYFVSFTGSPQSKQQLSYRENKILFMNHLHETAISDLYYRPYSYNSYSYNSYSYKDSDYMLQHHPKIKILSSNLHKEILKCNLLVLDHPGTTLLIALAANVPFICFWDKTHFPFSSQSASFLSRLTELQIFFPNPIDAAQKVNSISKSIESWWFQAEIQECRNELLKEHGIINKKWRSDWFRYFNQIHYE